MADKTIGFKITEELHDKVKTIIENSGDSAKDWFEKAVAMTEIQAIKQGASDYTQDLNELEVHTTRIYELISNMVQRSVYIKDHAVKEVTDKLDKSESKITEYAARLNKAIEERDDAKQQCVEYEDVNNKLIMQLADLRGTNSTNLLLIEEYKDKNDTLSGLVNKYQAYADENEVLKVNHDEKVNRLESAINEMKETNDYQMDEIKEITQQLEATKEKHANELESVNYKHAIEMERLFERKEFEHSKALLELEREYQAKLQLSNDEYNSRIKVLYDEQNTIRKEYEQRLAKLEEKLEGKEEE